MVGGLGALIFPGLGGAIAARAGESTLRSSLFKTGYEIFFTPIASHDKRAAKSINEVGFDRERRLRCRLATDAFDEVRNDQGNRQHDRERQQILDVVNGECALRRNEQKVECRHGKN